MRLFWIRAKDFLKTAVAIALLFAVGIVLIASRLSAFPTLSGVRTYYLYSPSSQAQIKWELALSDLFSVTGESVAVELTGESAESAALRLIEEQKLEVVREETVCGVRSYYCRGSKFSKSTWRGGERVNVQIAVHAETQRLVVGTPIIFGGY